MIIRRIFKAYLELKIGIDKVVKMPGNEQWCQHKGWPKDRPVEEKLIESWEELSECSDIFKTV